MIAKSSFNASLSSHPKYLNIKRVILYLCDREVIRYKRSPNRVQLYVKICWNDLKAMNNILLDYHWRYVPLGLLPLKLEPSQE